MSRSEHSSFSERVESFLAQNQNNGPGNRDRHIFSPTIRSGADAAVPSVEATPSSGPKVDTGTRTARLADFITGGVRRRGAELAVRPDTIPTVREQGPVAEQVRTRPPAPFTDVTDEQVEQPTGQSSVSRHSIRMHGEVPYVSRRGQAQRTETQSEDEPKRHRGRAILRWWAAEIKRQSDHDICSGG